MKIVTAEYAASHLPAGQAFLTVDSLTKNVRAYVKEPLSPEMGAIYALRGRPFDADPQEKGELWLAPDCLVII